MKNLTLDLEALAVESFAADEVQTTREPVDEMSCIPEDCGPRTAETACTINY